MRQIDVNELYNFGLYNGPDDEMTFFRDEIEAVCVYVCRHKPNLNVIDTMLDELKANVQRLMKITENNKNNKIGEKENG